MLNPPRGRLISIDALRGAAAMAVLLFHAITFQSNSGPTSFSLSGVFWFRRLFEFLRFGDIGVPLFFVISGFCIHLRWAKQRRQTETADIRFLEFWKRRLWRLYPPYLAALCLSMSLVYVAFATHRTVTTLIEYPGNPRYWVPIDFTVHALMLHGLHPVLWKTGGNAVYWTLAIEEYFYLLYFPLLLFRRRFGLGMSLACVLGLGTATSVLAGCFLPEQSRIFVNSSAPVLWIQWCLGMVAAEAYVGLIRLPSLARSLWLVPLWLTAAVVCRQHTASIERFGGIIVPLLWGMGFFTLMNHCIDAEKSGRPTGGLLTRWLAKVGLFSYSLYLIHLPVRSSLKSLLGHSVASVGPIGYCVAALAMAASGLFAGWAFFMLVERRFISPLAKRAPQITLEPALSVVPTPLATAG